MLTYLGAGERRYGEMPVRVYGRQSWEFEAVLGGEIRPVFPGENRDPAGARGQLRENSLWIFPPAFEHGWSGRPGNAAEIAVFHFDTLAEPAAAFLRRRGFVVARLDDEAKSLIRSLAAGLSESRAADDPLYPLRAEKAAIELSLIALGDLSAAELAPLVDRAEYAASLAMAWYSEHLAEGPTLADAARAANCSESHFRRLFRRARGASPQEAFERLRLERAAAMLRRGDASIKEIAAACGYESQSCFSRAFRRHEGRAPREVMHSFPERT
ncbi:MAG: hypothetical protein A2Z99_16740 [Treponema sp. GWB1_62_6]|nr:MAG: hypothetical protein A2Y36_07575 [Treponema sp. GWA1_62_8]OHE66306.1 MAG: hypothetical protein A2001_18645 [Treponema sp. GWC1_61_84]OHE71129.1 MAG: hypothetical protein A2Z99_16740 [Treponema sp. GWB1_62_6]HCM26149.1 hypothetical protein [Treponema sp.]